MKTLVLCGLVYGGTDFSVFRGVMDALRRRKRAWIPTNGVQATAVDVGLLAEGAFGLTLLAQVLINQRYEVYFPEKRPFFLESAGFFQTPEPLFFSRRIIRPAVGGRMTGKVGRWNIGSLVTADRVTPDNVSDDRAQIGVVRCSAKSDGSQVRACWSRPD